VLAQQLRGYRNRRGNNCRGVGGHSDCLHCRTGFTFGGLAKKCGKPGTQLNRSISCAIAELGQAGGRERRTTGQDCL
jgi:hypothetical protein